MASSFVVYVATGVSGDFAIPFDYFNINHVEARVNNTIVGFTVLSPNLIRIAPTPVAGASIVLRRRTPADLVVAPRDFPRLVRFFSEESQDVVFNFDAIYGDVFYDATFSIIDGTSTTDVVGVLNPNLTLSPFYEASSVAIDAPVGAPVSFALFARPPALPNVVIATALVQTGDTTGGITPIEGALTSFPAGTVFTLRQTSSVEYGAATVLVRFRRL